MKVFSIQEKYDKPVTLCLGFFDCMHTGHQKLLNCARDVAESSEIALFTFRNSHFETLNRPTKLIYTFDERLALYESLGVQTVVTAQFDANFMSMSGRDFLQKLSENFNLSAVVCGEDFTCGSDLLDALGVKKFFENICKVSVVSLVKTELDNKKICSSLIRELLLNNQIEVANKYLSQPFFFLGKVVHGRNVGESLGFPTANLNIPKEKIAPLGVYMGLAQVDGKVYKSIVNIGNTPTFELQEQKVEAHLLDFSGDLYGKDVKISLLRYLRPIEKFDNAKLLREQLKRDIANWDKGENND